MNVTESFIEWSVIFTVYQAESYTGSLKLYSEPVSDTFCEKMGDFTLFLFYFVKLSVYVYIRMIFLFESKNLKISEYMYVN